MEFIKSANFKAILPTLVLFGLLRSVFWLHTFPNPDEAYYWLWGQHPDLSYYDHPPFHAWVQGIVTALFGRSFFTLRLPNLLSNGLLIYTYYQITRYLYGKQAAPYFWLTIALLFASPLYFLFLALAWNDHWLTTFALIAAFQFIQFLDSYSGDATGDSKRLYTSAICLGLAMLCKYNALFVGMGFLVAIASRKEWRNLFRDRRLYLAVAIVGSFLLPIVIWNFNNDFQSFRYYTNRSVDDAGFRLKIGELFTFLLVSVLTLSPVNVWAMAKVLKRYPRSTYQIVAVSIFATSTLSLLAISLVSTALYYWNILAYLLLFPLLPSGFLKPSTRSIESPFLKPASVEKHSNTVEPNQMLRKPLFWSSQFYGLLFAVLLVIHYSFLPLSAFASPDGDPDSRMLFGWEFVSAVIQDSVTKLENNSFLVATDYRSASALAYELNNKNIMAISDRVDQFDFWYEAESLRGRNAVILYDDWHPIQPNLLAQFEKTSTPTTISVKQFGIWIKNYHAIVGYHFKG